MKDIKVYVLDWGRSMYGGWYVSYIENGYKGEHFDKIYELRAWAREHGVSLKSYERFDNI